MKINWIITYLLLTWFATVGMNCNSSRPCSGTSNNEINPITWEIKTGEQQTIFPLPDANALAKTSGFLFAVQEVNNPQLVAFSIELQLVSTEWEEQWANLSLFPADQPTNFQLRYQPLRNLLEKSSSTIQLRITINPLTGQAIPDDFSVKGQLTFEQR